MSITLVASNKEIVDDVTIILRPDFPLAGVTGMVSSTDDATGETLPPSFSRSFRYSTDGVQYSDWTTLTDLNLAAVTFSSKDILVIEFQFIKSTPTDTLDVNNVNLILDQTIPENGDVFNDSLFESLIGEYEPEVLGWYVNVVNKLYGGGVLAKYIKETNINGSPEDFIVFWSSIAKFFAYFVVYARKFQNYYSNQLLLDEFLQERGMTTSIYSTLSDLQQLASNFYAEVFKRGTTQILNDSTLSPEHDGEFLRLICHQKGDEMLFNLYRREHFGWNLGNSSPLYRGMDLNENVNKYNDNLNLGGGQLVRVNPGFDYVVTNYIGTLSTSDLVNVKVKAFDRLGNPIDMLSSSDGSVKDGFFSDTGIKLYRAGTAVFFRGIIYRQSFTPVPGDKTNLNQGQNLIFSSTDIAKISVEYYINGVLAHDEIPDPTPFKLMPLMTPYSRGFIQSSDFVTAWVVNKNNKYSLLQLERYAKRYLLPYNTRIDIINLIGYTAPTLVDNPIIEYTMLDTDDLTHYTNPSLVGRKIGFSLDGQVQFSPDQFSFNTLTGTITPTTPFEIGQRLVIFELASSPIETLIIGTGTSTYSNSLLIGKKIIFSLDGQVQFSPDQFTFDPSTGTITSTTIFEVGQRLVIFIVGDDTIQYTFPSPISTYSNSLLVGRRISFALDGLVQYTPDQFTFDMSTGVITSTIPFEMGQRIVIFILA